MRSFQVVVRAAGSLACLVSCASPNTDAGRVVGLQGPENDKSKGGRNTACEAGFRRVGTSAATCENIDECAENPGICGNFGTCADATPGYTCTGCATGHESNGQTFAACVDIDECARGSHDCTRLARCVNGLGSFVCKCPENMIGGSGGDECTPALARLTVSGGTLVPDFKPEILRYTLAWPSGMSRYEVTATLNSPADGTIVIDGQRVDSGAATMTGVPLLSSHTATIEVTVAGVKTTYQIEATRSVATLEPVRNNERTVFGSAIDVSDDGNTLVVGAYGEDDVGAAHVYERTSDGWSGRVTLRPSRRLDRNDNFGISVAMSGDGNIIVVGAPGDDSTGAEVIDGNRDDDPNYRDSGAAYVFVRKGGTWDEQAYVKGYLPQRGSKFGNAIALNRDGNVMAISAPDYSSDPDAYLVNTGVVFLYRQQRDESSWELSAYQPAPNGVARGRFGCSLDLSDDGKVLVVGAKGETAEALGTNGALTDRRPRQTLPNPSGGAYVMRAAEQWQVETRLGPGVVEGADWFGHAVALSGDGNTLAVGAPRTQTARGRVHVFTYDGTGWTLQRELDPPSSESEHLGFAVALSTDGNLLIAGAPFENGSGTGIAPTPNDGAEGSGAAYVFVREGVLWSDGLYFKAPNALAEQNFGWSVRVTGGELFIGTEVGFSETNPVRSSVYVY